MACRFSNCIGKAAAHICRSPRPIRSDDGRWMAVAAGRPRNNEFLRHTERLTDLMEECREYGNFTAGESFHNRGEFPALAVGIGYGNGHKVPKNIRQGKHRTMLQKLLNDPSVRAIAGYQSCMFPHFFITNSQ